MTSDARPTFLLLGPLEVQVGGRPVPVGGLRQRALLALLLLRPNEVVARDRLVEELWGERPPKGAANALAALVTRLRRVLPDGTLVTRAGGYEARVEADAVDIFRFERLRQDGEAALAAGDAAAAAQSLRSALALWRGPPLDDFRYESFAESAILRLEELRLGAVESRIDADSELGRHGELVGELQSLVLEYPLRERFRAQLMASLYACGRQAEALEAYAETRRFLLEELGIDPSLALKELHQAILRQDASICVSEPTFVEVPRPRVHDARKERKVVTVLVVAATGAPSDPEEMEAILVPLRERFTKEVERYGGTVGAAIGGILSAFFGVPAAHEDDPERALRAALTLRGPDVRLAIATGETLVSPDRSITGDVVDAAARLQAEAPANGVLVDARTFRATRRVAVYEQYEDAWEAIEAHAVLGVDVRNGISPFVGRERELNVLLDAQARVAAARAPQIATIVGVPGIGKSRLVRELLGRLDATSLQGRCLPYGDGVTLWALGEMVKAQAAILNSDGREEAAAKLSAAVGALVADPREARWIEHHLGPLVGLDGSDEGGRGVDEAFSAWRHFFEALADEAPLALVFEDLHWADEQLLDFVEHLAAWSTNVPLLIVATTRPELFERRSAWAAGTANTVTLSLAPLADTETAQLVEGLLGSADEQFIERVAGNPLYAEEFARLTLEGRALELPETVQGIIAARLDELSLEEKDVLQAAAVIGKVFWLGSVAALTGTTAPLAELLHRLELKQFVRRERRSSVAGEVEYVFRHVLVRDAAYARLPRERRAAAHRAAASWLESLARPSDHAETLAHHYLEALALGPPDDALALRAGAALGQAGERALALNAFAVAVRFFDSALELLSDDEHHDSSLLLAYGTALYRAADERAIPYLETLAERLIAAGEGDTAASALAELIVAFHVRGEKERRDVLVQRVEELVRDAPASRHKALALSRVARFRLLGGDKDSAAEVGEAALAAAEQFGLVEVQASALDTVALVRFSRGDDSAIADLERAVELARSITAPEEIRALHNLGSVMWELGEGARWRKLLVEAQRVGDRIGGVSAWRLAMAEYRAALHYADGSWDRAHALMDATIRQYDAGAGSPPPPLLLSRAQMRVAFDEDARALDDIARAVELVERERDPQNFVPALGEACRLLVELDRLDDARNLSSELAVHLRASWPLPYLVPSCWVAEVLGLSDLFAVSLAQARHTPWLRAVGAVLEREWPTAADAFAEIEVARDEEAAARLRAGRALAELEDHASAGAQLERALAFYRSVGATRYIRETEALLGTRVAR